jgi:hypothetical protein
VLKGGNFHRGEIDDPNGVDVISVDSDTLIVEYGVEEVVGDAQTRLLNELSLQSLERGLAPVDSSTR